MNFSKKNSLRGGIRPLFTVLNFFKNFNNKYKQKLDFTLILQSKEEKSEIINKVGDYLLDFFFVLNIKDDEEDEILYKKIMKDLKCDDYFINEVSDEIDNDILSFNEIYPKKINKGKKKRNFKDAFDEENELKKFIDNLSLTNLNFKDN